MRAQILLLVGSVLLGCYRPPSPGSGTTAVDAEPDRLACQTDRDCVVAPYPLGPSRCCIAFADAHSLRWDRWLQEFVRRHCPGSASHCEPGDLPAAPAPPAPCYFQPRCLGGRCGNGC